VKRKSTLSTLRRICRGSRVGCKILPIAGDTPATTTAFTLIELLIVIAIIVVLTGLILTTIGYVQKKQARTRAETEIAAISAACESYKADNGIYPRGNANLSNTTPCDTDNLDARQNLDPSAAVYSLASLFLYEQLAGVTSGSRSAIPSGKTYFTFKPNMLSPTDQSQPIQFIRDPFGNSYGYSTANQADPVTPKGYNPTFDLWSTSGIAASPTPTPPATQQNLWIKNW
jgi:prepilin-type N-terminal cleavage/methylation domain-containing protein